ALRQYDRGKLVGIPVEQIEQILVCLGVRGQPPQRELRLLASPMVLRALRGPLILIRATQPLDIPAFTKGLGNLPTTEFQGKVIYRASWGHVVPLDDRTIASGALEILKALILREKFAPPTPLSWEEALKKIPKGQVALAVGRPFLLEQYQVALDQP